jgi:hypothetical protein
MEEPMTILPWHAAMSPCGACGELVPLETGCKHWRPEKAQQRAQVARATRERINSQRKMSRAEQKKLADEFAAMLGRRL